MDCSDENSYSNVRKSISRRSAPDQNGHYVNPDVAPYSQYNENMTGDHENLSRFDPRLGAGEATMQGADSNSHAGGKLVVAHPSAASISAFILILCDPD